MPQTDCMEQDRWQQYEQSKTWNRTHKAFLENVRPEVVAAANATSKNRFINTKYLCEEVQANPQEYPSLSVMAVRAMKGTISLCCNKILKWKPRTTSHNNRGGRIFERTDL